MIHKAFFGDAERTFALSPELMIELERKTGTGIGGLCRRVFDGQFSLSDISETIRLALVGGGTTPADALSLVEAYALKRPLLETFPLAVAILETVWFGEASKDPANG